MINFQFFAGLTRLFVCKELWRQVLHEIQECASFWLKFLNFLCWRFFISFDGGFFCFNLAFLPLQKPLELTILDIIGFFYRFSEFFFWFSASFFLWQLFVIITFMI